MNAICVYWVPTLHLEYKGQQNLRESNQVRERERHPSVSCENVVHPSLLWPLCPLRCIKFFKNHFKEDCPSQAQHVTQGVLMCQHVSACFVTFHPDLSCLCFFVPCLLYGYPIPRSGTLHRTSPKCHQNKAMTSRLQHCEQFLPLLFFPLLYQPLFQLPFSIQRRNHATCL